MVNVGDVCDYLLEKDIIQLSKKEEIMKQKPVPHGQIRHLLSHITRCGPKAFDALMYGFSDSGNQYLVDELIGPQKTKVPRSQKVPIPTEEEPKLPTKDEPMAQAKGEPNSNEEQELAWPLETDMVKEIQQCNVDDPKLQLQGTSVYSMTAAPKKGKVLMFKNYCLSDKKNDLSKMRQNIDTDSTNVDQVFKLANFTTKAFKDRTKEDIFRLLKKHTEDKEIHDFDCFCLILLSVGDNPHEFHDSKQNVITLNDIIKILLECPALKSKPKLIIMQTCCVEDWNKACTGAAGDQVDSRIDVNVNKDDLFVVCSTPEIGVQPWINIGDLSGSWFIQAFVHVFKNYAHQLPFLKLLEKVDKCLWNARYKESSGVEINRSVARVNIITKCDSKQLYFFPGIQGQPATPTTKSGIQCQPTSPVPTSQGEIQSSEVYSTTVDKDMGQSENQMKGDNCGETCTETNDKVGQSYSDISEDKMGGSSSLTDQDKLGQACSEDHSE